MSKLWWSEAEEDVDDSGGHAQGPHRYGGLSCGGVQGMRDEGHEGCLSGGGGQGMREGPVGCLRGRGTERAGVSGRCG